MTCVLFAWLSYTIKQQTKIKRPKYHCLSWLHPSLQVYNNLHKWTKAAFKEGSHHFLPPPILLYTTNTNETTPTPTPMTTTTTTTTTNKNICHSIKTHSWVIQLKHVIFACWWVTTDEAHFVDLMRDDC